MSYELKRPNALIVRWPFTVFFFILVLLLEFAEHQIAGNLAMSFDILEVIILGMLVPVVLIMVLKPDFETGFLKKLFRTKKESITDLQKKISLVLLVENQSILGGGLESLLSKEKSLNVFGFIPQNEMSLLKEIIRSEPDVVVLYEDSIFTNPAKLLSLLVDYPDFQVLVISDDEDSVQIFSKQHRPITEVSDLVGFITGNPVS